MTRKQKFKGFERKWGAVIAVAVLALLGLVFLLNRSNSNQNLVTDSGNVTMLATVDQGAIASSTLLTGTVKVAEEEKIYFDASRGSSIAAYYVNVGDYVYQGQQLFQYNSTQAQATYDQATRNLNKVNRQIQELQATGVQTTRDDNGQEIVSETAQITYNNQLQDLYDAHAEAQTAVTKAYADLAATWEVSAYTGRVVEINPDINQASQGGHLLMHIVSEGNLIVEGNLTEYDANSVTIGQEVKLTSKVYPDKSWTGRVSYVSNYPSDSGAAATAGSSSSASYPFRVTFTGSDASSLKQGFKMSIEVQNKAKNLTVPVDAIVSEGDSSYVWVYDKNTQTIAKQEVSLGKADAINQEVTDGLKKGQSVLVYPSYDLTEGQKLDADQLVDMSQTEVGDDQ
jgi:HlyD family secretion protein